jgi:tripartite-type tricarboxylate transporter receptor subunit TctC
VPYRGVGQSINDLIGGQIDVMFTSLPVALPHVSSGQLTALAVSTAKRSALAPDIATVDEAGLKGFDITTWWGLLAPAGTPSMIVEHVSKAVASIGNNPDVGRVLAAQGLDVVNNTPTEFAAHIKSEIETFARIVQAAGIAAN